MTQVLLETTLDDRQKRQLTTQKLKFWNPRKTPTRQTWILGCCCYRVLVSILDGRYCFWEAQMTWESALNFQPIRITKWYSTDSNCRLGWAFQGVAVEQRNFQVSLGFWDKNGGCFEGFLLPQSDLGGLGFGVVRVVYNPKPTRIPKPKQLLDPNLLSLFFFCAFLSFVFFLLSRLVFQPGAACGFLMAQVTVYFGFAII